MSKSVPIVQKFMTYDPVSVDSTTPLTQAQTLMQKKDIRHLPVMEDNEVLGIISDRDIKYALSLIQSDPNKVQVKDICHTNLCTAEPSTPIDLVAKEMAEHHYGCTVVLQNNKLVGIFTTIDACRALAQVLEQKK